VPELFAPPSCIHAAELAREDCEAWEHLETDRAGKEYMGVVVVNEQMPWDGLSWDRMGARGFGGGFATR
jgi:hypothetical protein